MASPTQAELVTQLQNIVKILDETRLYAEANTPNFIGMQDTLVQSLEGDFAPEVGSGTEQIRASLATMIQPGGVRALLDPHFRDWGKLINAPEQADVEAILDRLYQYFVDNSETVETRAFTFATPVAGGGNTGDGVIRRLNKDVNNFDLENQHVDAKTAKCIQDANSGTDRNREVFEFRGGRPSKDDLDRSGSGDVLNIAAVNSRDDSIILNSGFDEFAGTTSAPTEINNWTSDITVNGTNYDFSSTVFYLPAPDADTTVYSLNIKASAVLTQKLTEGGVDLNPDLPYFMQLAWNRDAGSATGTLALHFGGVSTSVVLAAQTGWNVLFMPIGTNNWYANASEQDFEVEINWTETGGTGLNIDDLILVPYTEFDGSYYAVVPGATSFLVDDVFTWTDTATDSKIQRWIWRGYDRYLPSSGAPTIPDPA